MLDGAWISQLRKGFAEYVILLTLRGREAYGYEILQVLGRDDALSLGESTVYPLLGRLTEEGYLLVREARSASGPPRRYYRLTPRGKDRLSAMTAYWQKLAESIGRAQKGEFHES